MNNTTFIVSDAILDHLVNFIYTKDTFASSTYQVAKYCLWDSLSCSIAALSEADCKRMLGPIVPGTIVPNGVPVLGTIERLDPIKAAFDLSAMIRWMDFNDTSFAGGHPSDSIGAIVACSYYRSQQLLQRGQAPLTMQDVLTGIIQAYEIQGMLSFANQFDQPAIGIDHVIGVKIASVAVMTKLLGGSIDMAKAALGNAWMDGGTLNAYRHVPNAGPRKSWAGADAASRALWHALHATQKEPGYTTPLSDSKWGFEKVFLNSTPIRISPDLGSFVIDNIIFKFYPCQRNVSTALEAAIRLHPFVEGRFDQIQKITIFSHDEAMRRTDKKGPLPTRAARDHCMQYIVAIGLWKGSLELDDYLDEVAHTPIIDELRNKMVLIENTEFSRAHHDISVRSCANAIQIDLVSGQQSDLIQIDYPMGDPIHRNQVQDALLQKFHTLTRRFWSDEARTHIMRCFQEEEAFLATSMIDFWQMVTGTPNES